MTSLYLQGVTLSHVTLSVCLSGTKIRGKSNSHRFNFGNKNFNVCQMMFLCSSKETLCSVMLVLYQHVAPDLKESNINLLSGVTQAIELV